MKPLLKQKKFGASIGAWLEHINALPKGERCRKRPHRLFLLSAVSDENSGKVHFMVRPNEEGLWAQVRPNPKSQDMIGG